MEGIRSFKICTRVLRREITRRLVPNSVTLTGDSDSASPLLAGRPTVDGLPTAYVCEHYTCRAPVTRADALAAQLDALARRPG